MSYTQMVAEGEKREQTIEEQVNASKAQQIAFQQEIQTDLTRALDDLKTPENNPEYEQYMQNIMGDNQRAINLMKAGFIGHLASEEGQDGLEGKFGYEGDIGQEGERLSENSKVIEAIFPDSSSKYQDVIEIGQQEYETTLKAWRPNAYQKQATGRLKEKNEQGEQQYVAKLSIDTDLDYKTKLAIVMDLAKKIENPLSIQEREELKQLFANRKGKDAQYKIFAHLIDQGYFMEGFNGKQYNFAINPSLKEKPLRYNRKGEAKGLHNRLKNALLQEAVAYANCKTNGECDQETETRLERMANLMEEGYSVKKILQALEMKRKGITFKNMETIAHFCDKSDIVLKVDSQYIDMTINGKMTFTMYGSEKEIKDFYSKVTNAVFEQVRE